MHFRRIPILDDIGYNVVVPLEEGSVAAGGTSVLEAL
jgi:hypothetical protein